MSFSRPVVIVLTGVVLLGPSACGKDAAKPGAHPTSSTSATGPSTDPSSATDPPSATSSTSSPAVGLPSGFPAQDDVPLVPGVVTRKDVGEGAEGRRGWVIQMAASGSRKQCFEKAAAALVAEGYTKQGELTAGDTVQAQFTSDDYAVVLSARSDGTNCQLGYEVGQVDH